jgi:hypothetical protein
LSLSDLDLPDEFPAFFTLLRKSLVSNFWISVSAETFSDILFIQEL